MTDTRHVWTELLASGPNLQRMFESHPLRLHYGSDHLSRPMLLLRVDERPAAVRLGEAVSVDVGERANHGEWSLVLTLCDAKLTDTFIDLCIDLADRSCAGTSEREALAIFKIALEEFRDLLTTGRRAALSLEELRGLVAELWFALRVLTPESNAVEALVAWVGPFGAPQDFRLRDGELAEIKAIHREAKAIRISSPEQLDPVGGAKLDLVTIELDECSPGKPGSVSLPRLIEMFQAELMASPEYLDELDRRLRALGVLGTFKTLETPFLVTSTRRYRVVEDFPRLRRKAVPLGVARVSYEIEIRALHSHMVAEENINGTSEV